MITKEQVNKAFHGVTLEENYNFLEEDLVKLAEAFINMAKPSIVAIERQECVKVVRSMNSFVAEKLQEIRKNA
jgi:Ca2+-binding EF-hand superfamily protein